MLKDPPHRDHEKKHIPVNLFKDSQSSSVSFSQQKTLNHHFLSANKPLKNYPLGFFKKHLHLMTALFSLIAIIISYHFWQDETQWVAKWMIIYTIFALFYWSIKPLIRRIREKWNR